jgi:anti-sigma factor RsiW
MTACPQFEHALLDRAAGAVDPASLRELEKHLQSCAACAQEAKALEDALELAALPPITPREQMALAGLPTSTLRAWRAGERRRQIAWGASLGAGLAAAAAAAFLILPMRSRSVRDREVVVDRNLLSDDVTVRALENWGMSGGLAGLSLDSPDTGDDDEGVDW